ncbi:MAG: FAD-dependent monooxygenase [Candidatus Dormibacteraeota bacterium]|uniref:FAD-dependent monooxygenase n=1 Tax=Candidatus Dormiibacter inghamiae TaxID=3127013 RepID=A0A934NBT5_9BACT|nr:FAD-dependent monooxygenase [Candidatus Dormibacteraeota bacterium]MBJ7606119.1 FAD-dependent monooxygenase [Candidatus Dormibacteraeota bacterium]
MEVLVVGGGIGGLATGIALRQAGHEVRVLERAAKIAEVGAGLGIWPNGRRALAALGAGDTPGLPVRRLHLRSWRGRLLSEVPLAELKRRYGSELIVMHRADLQGSLLEILGRHTVQLGSEVIGFEPSGSRVHVTLKSGRHCDTDLLVGADGIRSTVRQRLLTDGEPRFSGATCWRSVTRFALEEGTAFNWWGRGGEFGIFPLRDGSVYWFGVQNRPSGEAESARGRKADAMEAFASWPEVIPAVVQATHEGSILRNDLYDRPPVGRWSRGRVTLVGDAAHPMLPNAAQGACQALEDAATLGTSAQSGSIEEGLKMYEARRRHAANAIVSQSHRTARLVGSTNPLIIGLRDLLIAHAPRSVVWRQLESMMQPS